MWYFTVGSKKNILKDSRETGGLLEGKVKFCFVSEYLPDDSDKFVGIVPKDIVVRPAFNSLISLGGCIVPNDVLSCIYKSISQNTRATFG